jgi:hypothetical protein
MRCSEQQLKAISQLNENMHFATFLKWITDWRDEEIKECIHAANPAVNQGRAQVLSEITKIVDEAQTNFMERVSKREITGSRTATPF